MKKIYNLIPVNDICAYFNLGEPLSLPAHINNGLHQVWRLHTVIGEYAIKQLNSAAEQIANPNKIAQTATQEIAALMKINNVPTVVACQGDEGFILTVNAQQFMVYPWIEGKCLNNNVAAPNYCYQIGQLLAHIHGLQLFDKNLPILNWHGFSRQHWQALLLTNNCPRVKEAAAVIVKLDELITWSELAKSAQDSLNLNLIISHRDLDPRNVIWQHENMPVLIDWEYAGLINPALDLFIVALNWLGILVGAPNMAAFNAVLQGYYAGNGSLPKMEITSLYGYYGYVLDWIEWNLHRAIIIPTEAAVAYREAVHSINVLKYVSQHQQQLLDEYNQAIMQTRIN